MDDLFDNELTDSDDDLPKHVIEMIEKGRADIEAGAIHNHGRVCKTTNHLQ